MLPGVGSSLRAKFASPLTLFTSQAAVHPGLQDTLATLSTMVLAIALPVTSTHS